MSEPNTADEKVAPEELSIKEAAALLNKTERSVQRYIHKHGLPARTIFTPYGRRTLIRRSAIEQLAELLAKQIADTIPQRRNDDPLHPPSRQELEQGGPAAPSEARAGTGERRNDAHPEVPQLPATPLALPQKITHDELRELLTNAIASGMKRAIDEAQAQQKPRFEESKAGKILTAVLCGVTCIAVALVAYVFYEQYRPGGLMERLMGG
jgi:excisionase family DNA binding protein